ncbi:hypothetical protein F5Y17DRAFT_348042 [Xylariaceae sp. FL0594]|nr:hypothetical protein F5Y17DRAFT_348042 [Xylariaceae sp. FL0594]
MSRQLPEGAEGAVAVAIIYSSISWACSVLIVWLTWAHKERLSYVACLAYYSLLSTTASIIQQIHDVAWWRDIAIEQYRRKAANPNRGEVYIANGSTGVDLVLYYIQFYSYISLSLFVLFWASALAQSVYGLLEKPAWKKVLRRVNASGKIASAVLPLIFVLGIQAQHFRHEAANENYGLLIGIPFLISLSLGGLLMLAILFRYVQSRWMLVQFDPHNNGSNGTSNTSMKGRMPTTQGSSAQRRNKGMYDKWLMTRFSIAFVILAVFQLSLILFDHTARENARKDILAAAPDLSAERASASFYLFLPGNTPGIALFIVFGTTATFRAYMYQAFMPHRWRRRHRLSPTHAHLHHSYTRGATTAAGAMTAEELSRGSSTRIGPGYGVTVGIEAGAGAGRRRQGEQDTDTDMDTDADVFYLRDVVKEKNMSTPVVTTTITSTTNSESTPKSKTKTKTNAHTQSSSPGAYSYYYNDDSDSSGIPLSEYSRKQNQNHDYNDYNDEQEQKKKNRNKKDEQQQQPAKPGRAVMIPISIPYSRFHRDRDRDRARDLELGLGLEYVSKNEDDIEQRQE